MANYELIDEISGVRIKHAGLRIFLLASLCILSTVGVFFYWQYIYEDLLRYPDFKQNIPPPNWVNRATIYSLAYQKRTEESHDFRLVKNSTFRIKYVHFETDYSDLRHDVAKGPFENNDTSIVCYYSMPDSNNNFVDLNLLNVNGTICNIINIGMTSISNSSIIISNSMDKVLGYIPQMKQKYPSLKFLLCVGGGGSDSDGFPNMVKNHQNRKIFIQSLKLILHKYKLDGCDLDWEFPSAYNRERMHFSQLLYEIRQEYKRQTNTPYLLSVAVAAVEGIALFAYDVAEINKYADYVNLMSYDYHFYAKATPFTGINSPLYARSNEQSIMGTLNINYSVNWWLANGLDARKLVVGLPTYGHSYSLVNALNTKIGAPAQGYGRAGNQGFVSAGETCWFLHNNILSKNEYDVETCSPYASSGTEWISFENTSSMACKAKYIKRMKLGGAMIFSLNTDDFKGICSNIRFPLVQTVFDILKT